MRRLVLLISTLILIPACAPAPTDEAAPREPALYDIEAFLETTDMRGASFSPDGTTILVSSDASGIYNAYAVAVDGRGMERLTDSTTDAVLVRGYFPEDERFLYTSDRGGNERTHVFVRERDGSVVDLTPGDDVRASFAGWAQDMQSFFVATNERDSRFFDVYEYETDDYERALVYRDDTGYRLADVSGDGRYLALVKVHTEADTDVYLHDRKDGSVRHLTPHEGPVYYEASSFTADGTGLYLTTDEGSEFRRLLLLDLASGERTVVESPDWDVTSAAVSWGGRYLVVTINNDARTQIRVTDLGTGEPVPLPEIEEATATGVVFSRDETRMAFYASGKLPRDLYTMDLSSGEVSRLSNNLNPAIDPDDLVAGEVVRFDSYDGVEIPGVLYRPLRASAENRVPALVWVHGGPGGQSRVGYRDVIQYLVNHGYAVYAINNRGSSGYGKTFYHMDDRRHGDADLGDCVASKRMLVETGWVDPERIGIIGGSYGGYMVLAALAFRPEEFEVGVDIFGVANWVRTVSSIPPWWESFREALWAEIGHPEEDADYLRSISPVFHAENIVKPLLVLQGANDPRVLKAESDDMVAAARANGTPVEYIVFDDEGHGFRKKENQLVGYRAILEFLDRYLRGEGEAAGELAEDQPA